MMITRFGSLVICGAVVAVGCQRAPLQITADTQAAAPKLDQTQPAQGSEPAQEASSQAAPEKPEETPAPPKEVAIEEAVAAAPSAPPAPVAVAQVIAPLPAAIAIGPPKEMAPPPVPFHTQPRPAQTPGAEIQGRYDLYRPHSAAAEFLPKRLPEEEVIPLVFRPAVDEPELSRGDNPRPELPQFPRGLGARKESIDPNAVPPLAPLSTPQLERPTVTSDPGDRTTRSASLPPAQPTRPEAAPADPRAIDPDENLRAFRLAVPPAENDPPASVPAAKPKLPVAETPPKT
jgi:hypothetical protein